MSDIEVEDLAVEAVVLKGFDNLDPIQVYWEDLSKGQGRVTITCYGEAWTGYWSAMGSRDIREFFKQADVDYLANRIQGAQFQKHHAGHMTYLKRIVRAVKESLNQEPNR